MISSKPLLNTSLSDRYLAWIDSIESLPNLTYSLGNDKLKWLNSTNSLGFTTPYFSDSSLVYLLVFLATPNWKFSFDLLHDS